MQKQLDYEDDDGSSSPPPPPPPRGNKITNAETIPITMQHNNNTNTTSPSSSSSSEIEALQRQIAELVFIRAKQDRLIESQKEDISTLERIVLQQQQECEASQQHLQEAAPGEGRLTIVAPNPTSSETVSFAQREAKVLQITAKQNTTLGAAAAAAYSEADNIAERELVFRLQMREVTAQGDAVMSALVASREAAATMETLLGNELEEAHGENEKLRAKVDALSKETISLKERVAGDILTRVERNRLEVAAKRVSAPRVSRAAGLKRLEALERVAMQAHDDHFYVRQFTSSVAPVRNVTLVLTYFSVEDIETDLAKLSPEMVGFVKAVTHTTIAAIGEERGGYRVAQWGTFAAYAFSSPMDALQFATIVHQQLNQYDWPDPVVHCPSMALVPNPHAQAPTALAALRKQQQSHQSHKRGSQGSQSLPQSATPSPHIFAGPRLRTVLHYCTPSTEMNPRTGRILYYGKEVHTALTMLSLCARPGEIIVNHDWVTAVARMMQRAPPADGVEQDTKGQHTDNVVQSEEGFAKTTAAAIPPPSPTHTNPEDINLAATTPTAATSSVSSIAAALLLVKELLKRNFMDQEERSVTLERPAPLKTVQRHHAVNFASSASPHRHSQQQQAARDIHTISFLSVLPLSLSGRREYFAEMSAFSSVTSTQSSAVVAQEEELALIALGSRVMNGRVLEGWGEGDRHGRDDLARWSRSIKQRRVMRTAGETAAAGNTAAQLQQPALSHRESMVFLPAGATGSAPPEENTAAPPPWDRQAPPLRHQPREDEVLQQQGIESLVCRVQCPLLLAQHL